MQFKRVEVPTVRHHMVYPSLSGASYEPEKMIFHSNLPIFKH